MYLETTDLVAIMIALVSAVTVMVATAVQNARLSRAVAEYRSAYFDLKSGKQTS